jgi:hypothetical protein
MSIEGRKKAMLKHSLDVVKAMNRAEVENAGNPLFIQLAIFHISHQSQFKIRQIQCTPADRFNDDGTLKPEDMTGKVVTAAGGGNPEGLRVMLNDVLKDSGFKAEEL